MQRPRMLCIPLAIMLLAGTLYAIPSTAAAQVCEEPYPAEATLEPGDFTTSGFDGDMLDPHVVATVATSFEYTAPVLAWSLEPIVAPVEAPGEQEWLRTPPSAHHRALHPPEPIRIEDHTETFDIDLNVMVKDTAPHMATATVNITAYAESGTCVQAVPETPHPFTFTVGFYEEWDARSSMTFFKTKVGDMRETRLEFTSASNGPLDLQIEASTPPEKGTLAFPKSIVVPAWTEEHIDVPIEYHATNSGRDTYIFTITGTTLDDPNRPLKTVTIQVLTENVKVETGELPPPAIGIVVPLVVAGIFLKRRRA